MTFYLRMERKIIEKPVADESANKRALTMSPLSFHVYNGAPIKEAKSKTLIQKLPYIIVVTFLSALSRDRGVEKENEKKSLQSPRPSYFLPKYRPRTMTRAVID